MREIVGNIWEAHDLGHWIAITTNGVVAKDGHCVMGAGVAKQAAEKYKHLKYDLGEAILSHGNRLHVFPRYKLIAFPVKHHWKQPADLKLIEESARELAGWNPGGQMPVYLPRPGCGNGRLSWDVVKPIIAPILDDRFIVVELG